MASFKITKKALDDLINLGKFTQNKWGISQRNVYLKQLDECFGKLSENPNIGTKCDYIKEGYFKFPQGSHMIFYKPTSSK